MELEYRACLLPVTISGNYFKFKTKCGRIVILDLGELESFIRRLFVGLNKYRDFKSKAQIDISYEEIEELMKSILGNREKLVSARYTSEGDVNSCYFIKTSSVKDLMFLKAENIFIPKFYAGQVAKEAAASNLYHTLEMNALIFLVA